MTFWHYINISLPTFRDVNINLALKGDKNAK